MLRYLVGEKVGNRNGAPRALGLGRAYVVLTGKSLVALGYAQAEPAEVEVRWREGQQFAFTDSRPAEDLEG